METNIRKWGNSAGAVIPAAILKEAGLELGTKVDVKVVNGSIVLSAKTPKYTLSELLSVCTQDVNIRYEDRLSISENPIGLEEI